MGLSKYSPKRIILDRKLSIKKNSHIFSTSNYNNTVIFYSKASPIKIKLLKKRGIKLIKIPTNKNNLFDLRLVLRKVFSLGCRNLLVEGGKNLTNNFLKNKLFNEFYLFKSPNKLGLKGKLNISSELKLLRFKYKNKSNINSFTGNDIINIYS
tara:strand:+ start:81 stop:539 length:459 start_codon:yes stop_codon:yes gene_type:complete